MVWFGFADVNVGLILGDYHTVGGEDSCVLFVVDHRHCMAPRGRSVLRAWWVTVGGGVRTWGFGVIPMIDVRYERKKGKVAGTVPVLVLHSTLPALIDYHRPSDENAGHVPVHHLPSLTHRSKHSYINCRT